MLANRISDAFRFYLAGMAVNAKLTDGQLREIACEYMERMSALTDDGYGVGTPFY